MAAAVNQCPSPTSPVTNVGEALDKSKATEKYLPPYLHNDKGIMDKVSEKVNELVASDIGCFMEEICNPPVPHVSHPHAPSPTHMPHVPPTCNMSHPCATCLPHMPHVAPM